MLIFCCKAVFAGDDRVNACCLHDPQELRLTCLVMLGTNERERRAAQVV